MNYESRQIREEFNNSFGYIKERKIVLLIVMVVSLLVGAIGSFIVLPKKNKYSATTSVIGIKYGMGEEDYKYNASKSEEYSKIVMFYKDLVRSKDLASKVADKYTDEKLSVGDIQSMISVNTDSSDILLQVTAISENKDRAIKISNIMAEVYVEEMNNIFGEKGAKVLDNAEHTYVSYSRMKMVIVCTILIDIVALLGTVLIMLIRGKEYRK